MKRNEIPLISFVSLTYNHAKFVEDTIAGALSQDYPNMEIIISDDASPDCTYEVMQRYLREHPTDKNIRLNCNEKNMGLVPHLNYLMENFVHGDIVVLAGGDDISLPNRVSETVEIFRSDESIKMVTGQMIRINAEGEKIEQVPPMADGKYCLDDGYIQSLTFMCGAPGMAFRREVWDRFGSLHPLCPTEDSTLRLRALLNGQIMVLDKKFIKYRIHGNNISLGSNTYKLKTKEIARQYMRDLRVAKELSLQPSVTIKRLKKKVVLYYCDRQLSYLQSKIRNRYVKYPFKILQKVVNRIVKNI